MITAGQARLELIQEAWLAPTMKAVASSASLGTKNIGAKDQTGQSARAHDDAIVAPYSIWLVEMEERMAASCCAELRRPFFSANIIQFSLSTPERWRLRGNIDKYLHRKAAAGLLPENVRRRQEKAEFTVTYTFVSS